MENVVDWVVKLLVSDQFVIMLIMFAVIGGVELAAPARPVPFRHYAFNLRYALVNIVALTAFGPVLAVAVAFAIQRLGLGLIDLRELGFGGVGGTLVAALIGSFIFDFFQYWLHRFEHANKYLWQQHLLHHSDEHMNVTTTARAHFFESLLIPFFITVPTAILFKLPPVSLGVFAIIPAAWFYVTHANVRLGFGPLWWVLVSPNYHRIHHSLEPQHIDKNFALWFPILDVVFGTAWAPRRGECPATGVDSVSVATLSEAYLLPIVGWWRLLSQRRAAPAPTPPPTSPA